MKRMTMKDMKEELNREIMVVHDLKEEAFKDECLTSFFELSERLDGLHYAYHLINGNNMALGCYQSGLQWNSNGAKYTKKVVE